MLCLKNWEPETFCSEQSGKKTTLLRKENRDKRVRASPPEDKQQPGNYSVDRNQLNVMVTGVSLPVLTPLQAASWKTRFVKKYLYLPNRTTMFYIFSRIITSLKGEVRISVCVSCISGEHFNH